MNNTDILMGRLHSPTDWSHGVSQPLPCASCTDTYSIADNTFTMRADSKKVATVTPGRESVRLVSNDLFGDGVYIFDVDHIPLGCGTVSLLFVLRPRTRPQSVPPVASSVDNNNQAMALGRRNRCTRRGKCAGKQLHSYRFQTPTSAPTQLFYSLHLPHHHSRRFKSAAQQCP